MTYLTLSAYQFMPLEASELPAIRQQLLGVAQCYQLKGTILLSTEGINLFLSGTPEQIRAWQCFLNEQTPFHHLFFQESGCHTPPFLRLRVRIKREIITMGYQAVQPTQGLAPYLEPEQLRTWYAQGKEMIILDTRNDYEFEFGSFERAVHLQIKHFRQFPDAVAALPDEWKQKPVVTFCTGGIRCEKAAIYLEQQGFAEIYQLRGGILNYFARCGSDYYRGECFVFDNRIAVNAQLEEASTTQCRYCQAPQQSMRGRPGGDGLICAHCGQSKWREKMQQDQGNCWH